jgi:triphosphoribosyl-dephospho-CoA synthetase
MRREHLEKANQQVEEGERVVAGWIALLHTMQAEGKDVTVARDLLEKFKHNLEAHRSRRDWIERALREASNNRDQRARDRNNVQAAAMIEIAPIPTAT